MTTQHHNRNMEASLKEIFTRKFLQDYKADMTVYALSRKISQSALREASQGKTRYVQCIDERNGIEFSRRHCRNVDERIQKLVEYLKTMFPDSIVEYRESARLDGSIESGIVIDWS